MNRKEFLGLAAGAAAAGHLPAAAAAPESLPVTAGPIHQARATALVAGFLSGRTCRPKG